MCGGAEDGKESSRYDGGKGNGWWCIENWTKVFVKLCGRKLVIVNAFHKEKSKQRERKSH